MNKFLKTGEIIIIYCEAFINFFSALKKFITNIEYGSGKKLNTVVCLYPDSDINTSPHCKAVNK